LHFIVHVNSDIDISLISTSLFIRCPVYTYLTLDSTTFGPCPWLMFVFFENCISQNALRLSGY